MQCSPAPPFIWELSSTINVYVGSFESMRSGDCGCEVVPSVDMLEILLIICSDESINGLTPGVLVPLSLSFFLSSRGMHAFP